MSSPRYRHALHATDGSTTIVVDVSAGGGALLAWGQRLDVAFHDGELDEEPDAEDPAAGAAEATIRLTSVADALARSATAGGIDVVAPVAFVAEPASGFPGRPGLAGRRPDGRDFEPRFVASGWGDHQRHDAETAQRLAAEAPDRDRASDERDAMLERGTDRALVNGGAVSAEGLLLISHDEAAGLRLRTEIVAEPGGVFSIQLTLGNDGDDDYLLDDLSVVLALPEHATELLTVHGRWCREFQTARRPLGPEVTIAENRRGRTSHQHSPLLFAGTAGFGEHHGEVWGAHLAWSGNARTIAGVTDDGRPFLQLGELLAPGEVTLAPGETYTTPPVLLVHSDRGLTPASRQFHHYQRARRPLGSRPVTLNTWEAVYFDHDLAKLTALATKAAELGVERFVLDDGWFGGRRDDARGLGDWWVSPDAHPGGLTPLIDHVTGLGMQFGLWVEPEMVNPDSDLYRAHPDWALVDHRYEPVLHRDQLVLDLANPDAYAEILGRLDALLADHDIAYLKWDMNRDLVQPTGADGRAGTRRQTLAVYRLLDELRRRHPTVEIESCASGGARIDLGILGRTDRVWTSDCNDALERQSIQRGASLLVPAEYLGAHVGPPTSHTTGRTHTLDFRAATAMFGHFGIEWNVLELSDADADELAAWVGRHRDWRELLHGGDVTRLDHPDPHALAHGALATDRRRALIAYVQLTTAQSLVPAPVRVPELRADQRYRVTLLPALGVSHRRDLADDPSPLVAGIELTGAQLAAHGVRPPILMPESVALLAIEAVGR